MSSRAAVELAEEALAMDRLGAADMTLAEAGDQIGVLVATVRALLALLQEQPLTAQPVSGATDLETAAARARQAITREDTP